MNKKTSKFFTMFWLTLGIIWVGAISGHVIANGNSSGILIYALAAVVSFILAILFHKA